MKRLVLVRPSGPRNVGSALRALMNFGPGELFLVAPQRRAILLHPDFEQMAHGATDEAAAVRVVGTLHEALSDCTHAVGFTARSHQHRRIQPFPELRVALADRAVDPDQRLGLVFGAENNGLAGEEADLCQELVHVPTSQLHTSLNLASAIAIVLHGLFETAGARAQERHLRKSRGSPLRLHEREFLIARVRKVFMQAAWTERARREIDGAVDRVLRHAEIEGRDARAWHQAMRALGDESLPSDFGLGPEAAGSALEDGAGEGRGDASPRA